VTRSAGLRLAAVLLCGLWAFAPADAAPATLRMTEAEAGLAQRALDRGKLIYAYDRAAWHGTDDLREKLPDFPDRVGGWIVDGPAEAPRLIFYDKDEADPRIVYEAGFSGSRLVSSRVLEVGDDRSLSPARKAMIAARRAAIDSVAAAKSGFCNEGSPNTVVLPPAVPGGPTLVYVMTPQRVIKAIPMGGHYLVEVAADGRAGKPRPFTKGCLELAFENEAGEKPAALFVTHLLDPVPTEIHVFSSLAAALPIIVVTRKGKRAWVADGQRILLVPSKRSRVSRTSSRLDAADPPGAAVPDEGAEGGAALQLRLEDGSEPGLEPAALRVEQVDP
jgi:hypothetical protein